MKKILTLLKLTVTAVTVTVVMSSSLPVCPHPASSDNPLFPNPDNCSQYFQCDNGIPVLVSCPPDLYYCSQLQSCTWPWDPNCTFNCGMGVRCPMTNVNWTRCAISIDMLAPTTTETILICPSFGFDCDRRFTTVRRPVRMSSCIL